jgi:hypothetical protein
MRFRRWETCVSGLLGCGPGNTPRDALLDSATARNPAPHGQCMATHVSLLRIVQRFKQWDASFPKSDHRLEQTLRVRDAVGVRRRRSDLNRGSRFCRPSGISVRDV